MERLQKLISLCKADVCLFVNHHRSNYDTIEEYLSENDEEVDPEILKQIIERDCLIELQFYPNTPGGFYKVIHYDFGMALDQALRILLEQ